MTLIPVALVSIYALVCSCTTGFVLVHQKRLDAISGSASFRVPQVPGPPESPRSFEPGRPSTSPGALRPSSPRENRVQSSQAIPAHMDGVSLLKVEDSRDMLDDDTPPFMETRKTKIVCTIGPGTNTRETLFKLADEGMNVARLNMSHGDHASHKEVVDLIKEYNSLGGKTVAILLDTKGPEVRSGDLKVPIELGKGEKFTFTITPPGPEGYDDRTTCVNYDGFIDDVSVGDRLLVDGGIMSFDVLSKTATNVMCEVVDGGTLASRRHLNIRGKSANLPAITDRDWADINFGIDCGVDYYALSFVRDGQVVRDLKKHLAQRGAVIGVLSKIESADSIHNLDDILDSSDGAMVARGDLGAELPFEEVPFWQSNIIQGCRRRGKPVIVATNMLESMISNPTPTRAEVSDIAIAVRQGTDSVMLSGETAYGAFPFKSVNVMGTVARNTEQAMRGYKGSRRFGSEDSAPIDWISPPRAAKSVHGQPECSLSEMLAFHTTTMANALRAPIVVFSHKGTMPSLLSHYRPDYPIFAFTDSPAVKRRLALYHGVTSIQLQFSTTAEATFDAGIQELVRRRLLVGGEQVVMVQSGRKPIWRASSTHAISVRKVPFMYSSSDDEDVI